MVFSRGQSQNRAGTSEPTQERRIHLKGLDGGRTPWVVLDTDDAEPIARSSKLIERLLSLQSQGGTG